MRYIALLRGINVGGNTMIKMSELKSGFESVGFENVVTYINSGNLAFDNRKSSEASLISKIETLIEKQFAKSVQVMVREQGFIQDVLEKNPFDGEFESHKEMHVLFLKDEMPADKQKLLAEQQTDDERFAVRGREIYCHLKHGVIDSLLGKGFIDKKMKVTFTARNWRTVEKLAEM